MIRPAPVALPGTATTKVVLPLAEPAERPMLGGNQSVVIRNDVMVTIQDALAFATALDVSDRIIVNEEQSNSDDDGDSSEDSQRLSEMNSMEHEFFDIAPDLDEGIPTETEKRCF